MGQARQDVIGLVIAVEDMFDSSRSASLLLLRSARTRNDGRPSKRQHAEDCPPQILRNDDCVRAFAYGDARARQRVRLRVPDWDDARDTFVA